MNNKIHGSRDFEARHEVKSSDERQGCDNKLDPNKYHIRLSYHFLLDAVIMNNSQFRKLVLDTPARQAGSGESKSTLGATPSRNGATPSALGSRMRSSIPMTPYVPSPPPKFL